MTNFDRLKEIETVEDMAHFLCDSMDFIGDGFPCEVCSVREKCKASELCGNGWFHWLREEAKC